MESTEIIYQKGLPEEFREQAAALYEEAFGQKFMVAVTGANERIEVIKQGLMPEWGFAAIAGDRLVGIAGINTQMGSLTGGITWAMLVKQLGYWRASRAALVFSLFERKRSKGKLLMDGIAVHPDFRGKGIGSRLLDEVETYGRENGFRRVRLDVIEVNSRAKALYEAKGFQSIRTEHFPYLQGIFGFGSSTTMERVIPT